MFWLFPRIAHYTFVFANSPVFSVFASTYIDIYAILITLAAEIGTEILSCTSVALSFLPLFPPSFSVQEINVALHHGTYQVLVFKILTVYSLKVDTRFISRVIFPVTSQQGGALEYRRRADLSAY